MAARRILVTVASALLGVAMVVLAVLGTAGQALAGQSVASSRSPSPPQRPKSLGALVDGVVERQLKEYRIPGAAVVVVSGGRQVLAKGYGVAHIGRDTPVTADRTGFFMASDAKVFTATAVLQLAERGKLDLNADVNRYLKSFKIKDSWPGQPVTVADLLTHTAGFDNSIIGRASASPERSESLGESLAAHQPRRVRAPGTVASYDNYGVALAGYLVEEVSGRPFASYLQQHVLRPLGMNRTSFAQPHPARVDAGLARGYRPDGKGQQAARGQYGAWSPTGAGAVTTAADMGRLLRAQLGGGRIDGHRVLSAKSNAAMHKRQFGNDPRMSGIGYILEERRRDGHRMLVKDGDVPGFHGNLALLPDRNTGVYVVYNGDGEDGRASFAGQELVNAVSDHYYGSAAKKSAERSPEKAAGAGADRAATGKSTAALTPKSGSDAEAFAGDYRSTRTSQSDLTRAAALTSSVHVSAASNGTLTTTGPLTRDPDVSEQHWVRVGPGVFQEKGGQDRIAFKNGDLQLDSDPTVAYERLAWYESPSLHQQLLLGSLAVLILSVLGWTVGAMVRRSRSAPVWTPGARFARLLAWCTGALLATATGCFAMLVADPNALNQTVFLGDSPLLTVVPTLILAALATTGAVLVCAVLAWRRHWWGWAGRVQYTATALASVLFLAVAGAYHLVG
ncbi:serine hydrolase domain-containing protein [Streptomyces sp. H27-D2]|uniref:serine hydrolase domain-containing protein n=1 Tax=Streptomyces sp. H27-D2 TaxID=3046304 RepID=UPI002DB621F8|nr:serine hydrolase domain-containing protein [Streptomyces sp. H27-D2]MEC4017538.1 serine hydrolase domain-containing protein [Streptomyces sp. H27-D2]